MNQVDVVELDAPVDILPLAEIAEAPRKLRVLLVEDDDGDAFLISLALSGNEAVNSILRARDGVQAMDMIDNCVVMPDLAIIDLHMPRKNGFDLLLNLSFRNKADFPCAVLTSSTVREDEVRSRLRGADFFVTKPKNMADLEAALAGLIRRI